MKNSKPDMKVLLQKKFQNYTDSSKASSWLEASHYRVKQLFEIYTLSDSIFEPFGTGNI